MSKSSPPLPISSLPSSFSRPLKLYDALKRLFLSSNTTQDSLLDHVTDLLNDYSKEDLEQAVVIKGYQQQTLLHYYVCNHKASAAVTQLLLDADHSKISIVSQNQSGRYLPLHVACYSNAPTEVVQSLLSFDDGHKTLFVKDNQERTPLHWACCKGSVSVVSLLLERDVQKTTVWGKDKHGRLPIHLACYWTAPVELVQLLLDNEVDNNININNININNNNNKTMNSQDDHGNLPLHVALTRRASIEVIWELLEHDQKPEYKSVHIRNQQGQLPMDIACSKNYFPVEVIECLLLASTRNRIEKLGLERWKMEMEDEIRSITQRQGGEVQHDNNKQQMVKAIYKSLWKYERMERSSLLELAVWKASCTIWDDHYKFPSIKAIASNNKSGEDRFNSVEYKIRHRTTGGVGVIVPNVLPFLPLCDGANEQYLPAFVVENTT